MKEVDPGHEYLLDSYDGGNPVRLIFVKREGEGYPFNVGHHPGTNCQEVWRASIARIEYLQKQKPCAENVTAITKLRELIWLFETRAARRHERTLPPFQADIETLPTCAGCGHIGCEGNHKSTTAATTPPATPSAAAMRAAEEIYETVAGFNELDDLAHLSPGSGNRKHVSSAVDYRVLFDGAAREIHESQHAAMSFESCDALRCKMAKRLLSATAPTAAPVTESWMPIETAPKDRTILVFAQGYVVTVKWRYDDRWGGVWGSEDYIQDGSIDDTALIAHDPTYWQPLPPEPSQAKEEG